MSPYRLRHIYVREGDTVPEDLAEVERAHVESEAEGAAVHVWWFAWEES